MSGVSPLWKGITALAALLAVVGVGAAAWYGYSWSNTSRDGTASVVATRDSALDAARQLAVTLQTADPAQPEQAYQTWQSVSTGPLLARLQRDHQTLVTKLKQQPTRSTASMVDVALSDLDADAGTATAIVALDVTQAAVVNGTAGQPTVQHLRVKLTMSRTDAGWKVAGSKLIGS
ncbi:MAG TPA: hypothetical protein VGH89_09880 [Pseudonocardia sp.]|jgi:Mce-associated membrane protein